MYGRAGGAQVFQVWDGQVVHASAAGLADVEQKTPYTFNTFCRMYCVPPAAKLGWLVWSDWFGIRPRAKPKNGQLLCFKIG